MTDGLTAKRLLYRLHGLKTVFSAFTGFVKFILFPIRPLRRKLGPNKVFLDIFIGAIFGLSVIWLITHFNVNQIEAAWFDDSYTYRQRVDITNGGINQTDYQVSITLNTSTLITAGKMQSDCDDIRVTDINGKLLPHWLEESNPGCNQTTTKIWTKVPSITTSGAAVYIYYGNPSASNYSNGHLTFTFFDDFAGDLSRWTNPSGCAGAITSGVLQISTSTGCDSTPMYVTSLNQSDAAGYAFDFRGKFSSGGSDRIQMYQRYRSTNTYMARFWRSGTSTYYQEATPGFGANTDIGNSSTSADTWYNFSAKVTGSNNQLFVNGTSIGTIASTHVDLISETDLTVALGQYQTTVQYDNVRVRKSASTEPTIAAPTNEEKAQSPVGYWKFDDGTGTTAQDSSQNNYDGTLVTSPVWQTEDMCVSGKCLKFSGTTTDHVTTTTASNLGLSPATQSFSISLWFKTTGTAEKYLFDNFDGVSGADLSLRTENGTIETYIADGTNNNGNPQYGSGYADGRWHHVVLTWNGSGTETIYADGVQIGTRTTASITGSLNTSANMLIGARTGSASLSGFMDEVKVYRFVLTTAQIKANYVAKTAEGGNVLGDNTSGDTLSNGLVGYWKMDEAAANSCTGGVNDSCDSSGNANNGAWNGDATTTTGKYGNGVTFDGTGDSIQITDSNSLDVGDVLTISAWVKKAANGAAHIITQKDTAAFSLYFDSDNTLKLDKPGTATIFTSTSTYTDTNWHHVVATKNDSAVAVYVDGAAISGTTNNQTLASNASAMGIGSNSGSTGGFFNGRIDEFRLYNRALSPDEVSQLYNFAPGPVGYWNMDEGSSTVANDRSGNANTGTLTGGPTWTTGKYGKAVNLDYVDDYVSVADSSSLDLSGDMTVETWIYSTDITQTQHILAKRNACGAANYQLHLSASKFGFYSSTAVETTTTLSSNTWYHVAATVTSGGSVILYVNARQETTGTATLGGVNNNTFRIGHSEGCSQYFKGAIDDVKIYNYVRSGKQIVEDMNAGHPAPGSPVGSAALHWKFDEGHSTTANNSGSLGSTLNGTLTTSPTWTQSGKFGKAVTFGASDNKVLKTDDAALDVGTGDFSLSAWINPTTAGMTGYERIISKVSALSVGYLMGLDTNGGSSIVQCAVHDGAWQATANSPTGQFSNNTWVHLACTFNFSTGTAKVYVNGVEKGSSTDAWATLDNDGSFQVAGLSNGTDYFEGSIDEVKFYRSLLTADQVKMDMNQGASQILGSTGTSSTGTPDSSAAREYCVPGDSSTCNAPVGEWNFNEGTSTVANDVSGNANTGTLTNSPTWTSGKVGKGINFDGSDDYVSVADSNSLDIATAITVESWVNPSSSGQNNKGLIGKWSGQGGDGTNSYVLLLETGKPKFYVYNGTSTGQIGTTTLSANTWYHLAGVYNGSTLKIYVNGIEEGSSSVTGSITTGTSTLQIGTYSGTAQAFTGKIDNGRIFNYARSTAQIAWSFNKGAPVGLWKFDECQGTTAYDDSRNGNGTSNGNNGTITIGATGTYTSAGTCASGTSTHAWAGGVAGAGKRNYALSFDGTDDYVNTADSSLLEFATGDFSMGAWVNPTSGSSILAKGDGGGVTTTEYILHNNGQGFWFRGAWRDSTAFDISTSTWSHLFVTFTDSDDTLKIYVNGVLKDTLTSITGSYATGTTSGLYFAKQGSGATNYLTGKLDDIRIYNYALTATQIKTLYSEGAVNFR